MIRGKSGSGIVKAKRSSTRDRNTIVSTLAIVVLGRLFFSDSRFHNRYKGLRNHGKSRRSVWCCAPAHGSDDHPGPHMCRPMYSIMQVTLSDNLDIENECGMISISIYQYACPLSPPALRNSNYSLLPRTPGISGLQRLALEPFGGANLCLSSLLHAVPSWHTLPCRV